MSLTLVTAPVFEPVTLEYVKAQTRLDIDVDDELVRSYIEIARQWVEGQVKRGLATQTWDYAIDYRWPWRLGSYRIDLPLNPVSSVTSITYVDTDGASQTLAANQYTVVARQHGSYIVPAYNVTWPDLRYVPSAITVRFVAGEAVDSIPGPLKHAIALIVAHWYENREASAPKEFMEIPLGVEAMISPYRGGLV